MGKSSMKDHGLFKPHSFEDGQHQVVGDCNGFTMQERWDAETPAFAQAILRYVRRESEILDYGCGVGRLAKEILAQDQTIFVTGTDASAEMMAQASAYVDNVRFSVKPPEGLDQQFDLIYLVYVLQHVPAIQIRDILARIYSHLKDNGHLIYCSSEYRMAIRYDGQGFFDDRFLGVDLLREISRYFELEKPLFDESVLVENKILKRMITGKSEGFDDGLAHPAFVFKKRNISPATKLFNVRFPEESIPATEGSGISPEAIQDQAREESRKAWKKTKPKKVLLLNRLSPGDILVMTNAIRDLHLAYPGEYLTDVRTPCAEIFENNPYITKLQYDEGLYNQHNQAFRDKERWKKHPKYNTEFIGDIMVLDAHYPLIHKSGTLGSHFSEGHRQFLEDALEIKIPQTDLRPQIFLSQDEASWPSPALVKAGVEGPYWVINAGSKDDMSLKQYPSYQEVVNLLKDQLTLVQIGQKSHNHRPLEGVVDLVGQTSMRELFRLIYKAEGVITCVSLPMHIAAAFTKPCVVVAGAREGTRWELYPNHQFLYVNGCLMCATYDGCWRSKPVDCNNKKDGVPRCMLLIRPEDVAWAVRRYYEGGLLEHSRIPAEVAHV